MVYACPHCDVVGRKRRQPLTPYQKILRAAERGGSLRLSPEEVVQLSRDDAIVCRAEQDDEGMDGER